MALQLGPLRIASGVVQSPMAACTDLPFRIIAREKGLEFAYLEMVSAHALVQDSRKTLGLMKTVEADRPLGAQLVGCNADIMAEAAARIEDMGFDLVDLNLGCPVPKVTGGGDGAGSALLQNPRKAGEIFEKVVRAVRRIPVTVKMRLGYKDPSGDEAVEVARRAEDAGMKAVAVHGRTREQKYSGQADYSGIGRVKSAVKIPVIGNGDVRSPADARRLLAESGCDAVMLGRGALGNPWLYRNIANALARSDEPEYVPSFSERKATLLRHLDLELEHEGERTAANNMKRIASWYMAGLPGASQFRNQVCLSRDTAAIRGTIEAFGPEAVPA